MNKISLVFLILRIMLYVYVIVWIYLNIFR